MKLARLVVSTVVLLFGAPAVASAAGSIGGKVTRQDTGALLTDYKVEVYDLLGALRGSACTDGAGQYTVANLAAGTYNVRFAARCGGASEFAPEWFDGRFSSALADPVSVADGAETPNIDASVRYGARVAGTVTDASSGAAVRNVTVELLDITGVAVVTACTGADGTYALFPSPPGVYTVRFRSGGSCGDAGQYVTQFYEDSLTQAGARAIGLLGSQEILDVNTQLHPGVAVTLTVARAGAGNGSVFSAPNGISCPATCAGPFVSGSSVTLSASPSPGSTFAGWSGGGCSGTGTCVVTLAGDETVTATFAPEDTPPGGGAGGGGGGATTTPPTPLPAARLDTKLLKSSLNSRRGTAKFTFAGSGGAGALTFECSLVKKGAKAKFKTCRSGVTYRRLKKGSYVFQVRARDADGQLDASPATKRFKAARR